MAGHEDVGAGGLELRPRLEVHAAVHLDQRRRVALQDHGLEAAHLVEHRGDELLSAEARVDRHDEHQVEVAYHLLKHHGRSAGIDGHASQHPRLVNLLHGAVQVVAGFLVDGHVACAVLRHALYPPLRLHHHHVDVHRLTDDVLQARHNGEAERYVWHERAVHHVEVQEVGFRPVEHLYFALQVGEVGRQERGCDLYHQNNCELRIANYELRTFGAAIANKLAWVGLAGA